MKKLGIIVILGLLTTSFAFAADKSESKIGESQRLEECKKGREAQRRMEEARSQGKDGKKVKSEIGTGK